MAETEPRRVPLKAYGGEAGGAALEWRWARERIAAALNYWLVTVTAEGAPQARPLWGDWFEGRLIFSIGGKAHRSNLRANDQVTVHLGDPLNVVILEGVMATETRTDRLAAFAANYNRKYKWDMDPDAPMYSSGYYALTPKTVICWTTMPPEKSTPDMTFPNASGKWVFD